MKTPQNPILARLLLAFAIFISSSLLTAVAAPTSGKVTVAVGDVRVVPPRGGERVLKPGDTVTVGSVVKTGPNSRAVVVMTRQSAVRVAADTEVTIDVMKDDATNPVVKLDLKTGSMGALIDKDAATKMDFQIKTPSGVSAARGTFFSVAIENGRGFIKVKEGKVEIIPSKAP